MGWLSCPRRFSSTPRGSSITSRWVRWTTRYFDSASMRSSKGTKRRDRDRASDQSVSKPRGRQGSHVVRPEGRDPWLARTERRRQNDDHAHADRLYAAHVGYGAHRRVRRVYPVTGCTPPHRLSAGERAALSRYDGDRLPEVSRADPWARRQSAHVPDRRGGAGDTYRGPAPPDHPEAVQGLSAAGWSCPGTPAQSRRADTGRTDRGP